MWIVFVVFAVWVLSINMSATADKIVGNHMEHWLDDFFNWN